MLRKMVASGSFALLPLAACFSPNASVESQGDAGPGTGTTNATGTETDSTESDPTIGTSDSSPSTSQGETDPGGDETDSGMDTSGGSSSDTDDVPTSCGNGERDEGESCDDGNDIEGDGCNNDCVESGSVIWTATFHEGNDTATSLSIDADDNILVLALVGDSTETFSNWQRLYSSNGDALETSQPGLDFFSADFDGPNIVGVYAHSGTNPELGWGLGLGEVELDGSVVWTSTLDTDRIAGRASALPAGGVVVGGGLRTSGISYNYGHSSFLAAFDASGSEAWEEEPFGTVSSCSGVAVGPRGRVAALCYEDYGATIHLQLYSAAAELQWERELDDSSDYWGNSYLVPDPRDVFVPAIAQNQDGRIAVALPVGINTDIGASVVVYESNGDEAYSTTVTGSGDLATRDLSVLADGSVVLVGSDSNPMDGNDIDIMVRRLDPEGAPLWNDAVSGSGGGEDRAKEVDIDSQGYIIVLGSTDEGADARDLWLRKYAP